MKYENYATVKNLVNQIEKHQRNLDLLEGDNRVIIEYSNGLCIFTISTSETSEHEYQKQAEEVVEFIRIDLQNRIENLKSQLDKL